MAVVLSILVVSHNQQAYISRCLDSVLNQKLTVSYEVIVSDDRSSDGTWEIIEDYMSRYPEIVKGVHCNSDECNPISRSERCGWNKATAYRNCEGDFFVNIDADDYLRSDDIYQKQVDALLSHPDCALCQQRVLQVNDGEPLENGFAWPYASWTFEDFVLTDGKVLSPEDVILNDVRGVNPTYMIRRNKNVDPTKIYGKLYDDSVITLHHLQYGNVIFIDRNDYVWVQYQNSISNSISGFEEKLVYALLPIQHAYLIPKFKTLFLCQPNVTLYKLLKSAVYSKVSVPEEVRKTLSQYDGFIFKFFSGEKRGLFARLRLIRVVLAYKSVRYKSVSQEKYDRLFSLMVG